MKTLALSIAMLAGVGAGGVATAGSPLTLSLDVDRTETSIRAPFQVWITLANASTEPVEGPFDAGLSRGLVVLEFGRQGEARSRLTYLDGRTRPSPDGDPRKTEHVHLVGPPHRLLGPGDVVRSSAILGIDPTTRTFLLDREGEYELRASAHDPLVAGGRLESNTIRIVVRPPGPTDRAVAEAFTPELALLVRGSLSGSKASDSLLQEAGAFIDRFPVADHTYLLRSALRRELVGRRGVAEVALAARLKEQDRLSPPVPPGGLERAAYDALTLELELIIHDGEYGSSGEAWNLPTQAYVAALEYAKRFEGTTYARLVRFRLKGLLQAKEGTKRITPEEQALLRGL